ncbi:hypothetical protein JOE57_001419 [Microlunatus panaciterrae]|uniref:Uncharacterized protein n=1 Tax=Microlunatus panaciterrae TaxID=400768 RepID=A0ABS2RIJ1_9ACTN|nr:hypothetical protein [Microlunatus panaciterrae]
MACHELVAFVHQDVYLHSIERLVHAGAAFEDGVWGLLGANGVTHQGENVGRMRDRAQVIGHHRPTPVDVDSVDEVLFLAPRDLVLKHPLTEEPELAWHAYAVEYGLRLRRFGKRVGAVDLGITHNSLTVNLAKLDVAHRRVGSTYPRELPIHTTCGVIGSSKARWRSLRMVREHGWRLRWLRHSLLAARVRRRIDVPVVLSDIRHEVDLVPFSRTSPLYLFNLDNAGGFAEYSSAPLRLTRYGRPVIMSTGSSLPDVIARVSELPESARTLVVGVGLDDLADFVTGCGRERNWLVGIHPAEIWLLGGAGANELPREWSRPEAVPLAFGGTRS